jgi:hypothetical protein
VKLWDRNISLTTRLVGTATTPMLLKIVRSGKLQPKKLVTHRFAMNDIMKAYDTFGNAAKRVRSRLFSRMAALVDEVDRVGRNQPRTYLLNQSIVRCQARSAAALL